MHSCYKLFGTYPNNHQCKRYFQIFFPWLISKKGLSTSIQIFRQNDDIWTIKDRCSQYVHSPLTKSKQYH